MTEVTWVLRIEGVNFATTLFDTQDLSTIRGSGLALLEAGADAQTALAALGPPAPEPIYIGASQAAFVVRAATPDAALASVRAALAAPGATGAPHPHLMYVADAVRCAAATDPAALMQALEVAEARNKARQFRQFTVAPPDPASPARKPDALDHARQGTTEQEFADKVKRPLSASVKARREFGRSARHKFYEQHGGAGLAVTDSLQAMLEAPRPPGLPAALGGKVAYLYADGNGFGAIRAATGPQHFAAALAVLQRGLLRRLIAWLDDGIAAGDLRRATAGDRAARFETLMWGGDEFLFVMPAWLALPVLGQMAAAMSGWTIGQPLTHAFGLAICHHKTPVRQATAAAQALAESAKAAQPDGQASTLAAIQVFESLDPLDAPLAELRGPLFGVGPDRHATLHRALAIHGDALPGLVEHIAHLTGMDVADGGIPPGLLHRAIAAAQAAPDGLLGAAGATLAGETLAEAFGRFGRALPAPLGVPGPHQRQLGADLALIAMLRDYCALSGGDALPGFPDP